MHKLLLTRKVMHPHIFCFTILRLRFAHISTWYILLWLATHCNPNAKTIYQNHLRKNLRSYISTALSLTHLRNKKQTKNNNKITVKIPQWNIYCKCKSISGLNCIRNCTGVCDIGLLRIIILSCNPGPYSSSCAVPLRMLTTKPGECKKKTTSFTFKMFIYVLLPLIVSKEYIQQASSGLEQNSNMA